MKTRSVATLLALLSATSLAQTPSDSASVSLAQRLEISAQQQSIADAPMARLKLAAVTLEQAARLDPTEPRYLRLLADLALRTGDSKAALHWITEYRKLQPADQLAQVQFLDLTAATMEAAEERLKYYADKMNISNGAIADAVRSHAAAQAAHLQDERGNSAAADELYTIALKLNPLNLAALEATEARLAWQGDRIGRFKVLLDLLRANVAQPAVMNTIASELAAVGLSDQSITWYQQAFALTTKNGLPPDIDEFLDYTSVLITAGQLASASQSVDALLKARPQSVPGHFLKLLLSRRGQDPALFEAASTAAHEALLSRLNGLSMTLAGKPPEGETPAPSQMPDLAADFATLREKPNPDLSSAYLDAMADLAWVTVYFDRKPLEPQIVEQLKVLAGENSPLVARLEGYSYLVADKPVEARQKLSAVAENDTLAAMGLLQLRVAAKEDVVADARSLLARVPSGVVGAIVTVEIRPLAGEGPIVPEAAAKLRTELALFPVALLNLIDDPKSFYTLRLDPIKVAHDFGDGVYMRLSVTNRGAYPLTLGPGGVVGPIVAFDCATRGLATQGFGQTASEPIRQALVLQPKETIVQIVRVDGPNLRDALMKNPAMSLPLYFNAISNPIPGENGPTPGASGYRKESERVVERSSNAVLQPPQREALLGDLRRGKPARQISAAEAITATSAIYAAQLTQTESPVPDEVRASTQQLVEQLNDALARAADSDPSPDVRAWASYLRVLITANAETKAALVRRMLDSEEPMSRFLGIDALSILPVDVAVPALTAAAAREKDELIKQYAAATIDVVKLPPPATQPADAAQAAPTP